MTNREFRPGFTTNDFDEIFDKYKLRFLWGVLRWVDFYNVRTYVQIDVAITYSTFKVNRLPQILCLRGDHRRTYRHIIQSNNFIFRIREGAAWPSITAEWPPHNTSINNASSFATSTPKSISSKSLADY